MERSFPKSINYEKAPCSFGLEELINDQVPDRIIVREYLYGRFDVFSLKNTIAEPTMQMIQISDRIVKALKVISLNSIIEMVCKEDIEESASDCVPLTYNLEDPLFAELALLKTKPLEYETLGKLLPGCNAEDPASMYKYGEVCSKILALLDLVWIYKDGKTKVMLSPMGISFRKQTILERCLLFKKLIFKLEIIRNIYRTNPNDEQVVIAEISKWVNDSTIKRRYQSVNGLLKEINENLSGSLYDGLR